ncbi:MAG: trehalase [Flaviaesturariibacter sp.]|nr:trehalase [Flaviaesturariibacter sp.]
MRYTLFLLLALIFSINAMTQPVKTPDEIYGELFRDVQQSGIFKDSKTFVDCIPKRSPSQIVHDYLAVKNNPAIRFSLDLFVHENFIIPAEDADHYVTQEKDVVQHINNLWKVLRRKSDTLVQGSSLLALPYDYIVPGGRFREIYYWDSYFTMLGLKESGEYELIENMVKNFAYLIDHYGHIPNGNRTYYLSRSQPPFFSLMVELLAQIKGDSIYKTYLPELQKEYAYWMDETADTKHVAKLPDGGLLNRYWDRYSIPRQESYLEDLKIAPTDPQEQVKTYKHIRSAAESGWDFSSRWFADGRHLHTMHTTDIIPVDLNCLLYHLETTIAKALYLNNDTKAKDFEKFATARKAALLKYCWSATAGWFVDYNLSTKKASPELTLAGMTPFFLKLATKTQMQQAMPLLKKDFLKPGGVVTTLKITGEQWDSPNGWAPLQWMTIIGLENYGQAALAKDIARRWVALNKRVFAATGKLTEKYNVVNANKEGGGGEYPTQDGFGWTNGVLLALIHKYGLKD